MLPRRDPYELLIQQFLENTQNVGRANEQRFVRQREERLIDEDREFQEDMLQQKQGFQARQQEDAQAFSADQQAAQLAANAELQDERLAAQAEQQQASIAAQAALQDDEQSHADAAAARERENALTDAANAYRRKQAETLRGFLGFLAPGSEEWKQANAVFESLLQPTSLTGEEALRAATRSVVTLPDGKQVNANYLIASYQAIAEEQERNESWVDQVRADALAYMTDGTKPVEERVAYYNNSIADNDVLFNDSVRKAILAGLQINDEDAQAEILQNRRLREIQIAQGEQALARGDVALAREKLGLKQTERMADLEYEQAQLRVADMRRQGAISDAEAFITMGLVPSDDETASVLAERFGFASADEAREYGKQIFKRIQRMETVQADMLDRQYQLVGEQIDQAELERMITNWEFERTKSLADLEDTTKLTTMAFAAASQGDVQTLRAMESLADGGGYPALAGVQFDALIARAENVLGDEESQRAFEQARRQQLLRSDELQYMSDVDTFIGTSAALFARSDFTEDESGVTGLERDVDQYLNQIPQSTFDRLGLSKDDLKTRLISRARRNKVLEDESQAGAALDLLTGSVPPPEVDEDGNVVSGLTSDQEAWRDSFITQAELSGLDTDVAERVADGLLLGENQAFWKAYLDNERVKSVIELNLANARRVNVESDAIENPPGEEVTGIMLDDETHDALRDDLKVQQGTLEFLISSVFCEEGEPHGGRGPRVENETMCEGFKDELVNINREIQALSTARRLNQPYVPGTFYNPAEFGPESTDPGLWNAGLEALGNTEGVRRDQLSQLQQVDPEAYQAIVLGAATGAFVDVDDMNAYIADGLIHAGALEPNSNRSLDALNVGSEEWQERSPGSRFNAIAQTTEFQQLVERIASGEELVEGEDVSQAERFGFADTNEFREFLNRAVEVRRNRPEDQPDGVSIENLIEETSSTQSLVTDDGQATPTLINALFQQESGGVHTTADGNLLRNPDSGAAGIAQKMPLTAWRPGYNTDPVITPSPEDEATLNTLDSQRKQHPVGSPERNALTAQMAAILEPYVLNVTEEESRRFGRQYLNGLLQRFNGDVEKALAAYNAGPHWVITGIAKYGEDWKQNLPQPEQTLPYIDNILSMARR